MITSSEHSRRMSSELTDSQAGRTAPYQVERSSGHGIRFTSVIGRIRLNGATRAVLGAMAQGDDDWTRAAERLLEAEAESTTWNLG